MNETEKYSQIVSFFNRHCIPIYIRFVKDKEEHHYIYSSFLISINEDWFIISAGHCFDEIEKIKKLGYSIAGVNLIDYAGKDANYFQPVPFDFESSPHIHIKDDKYDYGIIYIENHYRRLLEKNGVVPLNEDTWEKQPTDPDFYFLLGVPGELTEVKKEEIKLTSSILKVEKINNRPEEFENTEAPTFYGKVDIESGKLKSIKGMSGGPLFSFKFTESGDLKYWLCAVQSRWIPSKQLIAACLIKPFATIVRSSIENAKNI